MGERTSLVIWVKTAGSANRDLNVLRRALVGGYFTMDSD